MWLRDNNYNKNNNSKQQIKKNNEVKNIQVTGERV